jgi:hypothetical protein
LTSKAGGEFKARCLRVMEDVMKYRTSVVITTARAEGAQLVTRDARIGASRVVETIW